MNIKQNIETRLNEAKIAFEFLETKEVGDGVKICKELDFN